MITTLFIVGAILVALLQTTWFSTLLLVPILLVAVVLYVDVVPASLAAFFTGLTLDVLGIHALGTSSAIVALLLVGGTELLRLSNRWIDEHPASVLIASSIILSGAVSLLGGRLLAPGYFPSLLLALFAHAILALVLVSVFQAVGKRYRASLRERGVM